MWLGMRKKRGIDDVNLGNVPSSSSGPSLSNVVDRSLEVALNSGNTFACSPMLPWDEGFLKDVLGPEGPTAMPWLSPLLIPRDLPPTQVPVLSFTSSVQDKVQVVRKRFYDQKNFGHDASRQVVIAKWMDLVLMYPEESTIGRLLLSESTKDESHDKSLQLITDWVAKKPTSTLKLRAGSFAMYISYCKKTSDAPAVPVDESLVYQYIDSLRSSQKPPTRAQTFLSTLAFVESLFGWRGAGEAAASQRVQGAAHLCFLRKRVLRQAPPLDVIAIAVLELCALFVEDPYVKGCACLCLFALYGRLRASDCNRVSHGRIIGNYFEGCLCRIKTARTLEKQTRFLPVIIPVKGILGVDWFSQFVNARDALGLDAIPDEPPVTTDNDFVLFPSQSTVLASEQERIGSAEMTERLGECLAKLLPTEAFQHYTSHSLKCTLLTYTNIFGLTLEQNELLGYHVVKGHASALNYSRDALASPIRAMATMLGSVKRGLFVPFAARDEQFVSAASAISVRQQFEKSLGITVETAARSIAGVAQGRGPEALDHESFCANLETLAAGIEQDLDKPCHEADTYPVPESSDDEDDSDSSSDSGSTSAESGMAVVDRELAADRYANVNVNADITRTFRHVRTKMLHYAHVEDMHKTSCGRMISSSFSIFRKDPEHAWPKCRVCWGR